MSASSIAVQKFTLPQHLVRFSQSLDCHLNPRAFLLHGQSPESIILDIFEKPAKEVKRNPEGEICITLDRSYGSSIRSKNTRQPGEIMFLQEFMLHTRNLRGSEVEDFGWKIQLYFLKVKNAENGAGPSFL